MHRIGDALRVDSSPIAKEKDGNLNLNGGRRIKIVYYVGH